MLTLVYIFVLGFTLNLAFTPLARALARRMGLVDRPDGRRKLQTNAIPVAGGPAVFVSVTVAVTLAVAYCTSDAVAGAVRVDVLFELLAAGALICAVGVIDDAVGLRGRDKLLGQCVAVSIVMACGIQVHRVHIFNLEIELGVFSIPLTMFLLLGAINSLNLLDGMDGLLGSVGLIVCLTFGSMAIVCGQTAAAWVAFALAGSLLAFLRYNFPPASIYLGDSGSMLVGLAVGVLAIQGSLKGPATIALIAPACVLVVPIFDTAAAIARRKLIGRSIFSTDRAHLHHCLLRSGLSRRGALLVIVAMCIAGMLGGLVSVTYRSEAAAALAALGIVSTLVVTRLFGYNEVRLVLKRLRYLSQRTLRVPRHDSPTVLSVAIQGTIDWQRVWGLLLSCAERLTLRQVRLDIEDPSIGESYHARLDRGGAQNLEATRELKIVFPLQHESRVIGRVEVLGDRAQTALSIVVSQLTGAVHEMEMLAGELIAAAHQPALPSVAFRPVGLQPVASVIGEGGLA